MAGLVFVFGTEQRLECVVAAFRADARYGFKFFFGTLKIHDVTHVGGIPIKTAPAAGSKGGGRSKARRKCSLHFLPFADFCGF